MKKQNTVPEAGVQSEQVNSAGLVTLAELAAEGFGWESGLIRTPKDAIDALARQLAELVALDDLGRRCVPHAAARDLFAARAAAEARQRLQRQRHAEERAKRRPRPPRGVPALGELSAFETMMANSGEDERRKDRAGERMAALMRGESTGATFVLPGGE